MQEEGFNNFRARMKNAGVVSAALAATGVSVDQYYAFIKTLLPDVCSAVVSRQALVDAGMATDEFNEKVFILHASERCNYMLAGDILALVLPHYFPMVCKRIINSEADKFLLPANLETPAASEAMHDTDSAPPPPPGLGFRV